MLDQLFLTHHPLVLMGEILQVLGSGHLLSSPTTLLFIKGIRSW